MEETGDSFGKNAVRLHKPSLYLSADQESETISTSTQMQGEREDSYFREAAETTKLLCTVPVVMISQIH